MTSWTYPTTIISDGLKYGLLTMRPTVGFTCWWYLMLVFIGDFRVCEMLPKLWVSSNWRDKFEEPPVSNIGNALASCRFSPQNQAFFPVFTCFHCHVPWYPCKISLNPMKFTFKNHQLTLKFPWKSGNQPVFHPNPRLFRSPHPWWIFSTRRRRASCVRRCAGTWSAPFRCLLRSTSMLNFFGGFQLEFWGRINGGFHSYGDPQNCWFRRENPI